jgi:hypothetical protein
MAAEERKFFKLTENLLEHPPEDDGGKGKLKASRTATNANQLESKTACIHRGDTSRSFEYPGWGPRGNQLITFDAVSHFRLAQAGVTEVICPR